MNRRYSSATQILCPFRLFQSSRRCCSRRASDWSPLGAASTTCTRRSTDIDSATVAADAVLPRIIRSSACRRIFARSSSPSSSAASRGAGLDARARSACARAPNFGLGTPGSTLTPAAIGGSACSNAGGSAGRSFRFHSTMSASRPASIVCTKPFSAVGSFRFTSAVSTARFCCISTAFSASSSGSSSTGAASTGAAAPEGPASPPASRRCLLSSAGSPSPACLPRFRVCFPSRAAAFSAYRTACDACSAARKRSRRAPASLSRIECAASCREFLMRVTIALTAAW